VSASVPEFETATLTGETRLGVPFKVRADEGDANSIELPDFVGRNIVFPEAVSIGLRR